MKIGTIDLGERPVLLAPMEDVTDPSFRLICKEQGADMVYTEFVSADALVRNINSTTRKLHTNAAERPVAIQIYGKEVEPMVEAAKIAEAAGPDVIDINFGCPVKKVASKGAGAGMLRDVPKPAANHAFGGRCGEVACDGQDPSGVGLRKQNHHHARRAACRTAASVRLQSTAAPAARCIPATPTGHL